ncbi:MAG: hypothetical protein H6Q91_2790 [Deltaproteobacteria bacterium]|nr:hypothetical protein [Deltaproteobacteria bacterium]
MFHVEHEPPFVPRGTPPPPVSRSNPCCWPRGARPSGRPRCRPGRTLPSRRALGGAHQSHRAPRPRGGRPTLGARCGRPGRCTPHRPASNARGPWFWRWVPGASPRDPLAFLPGHVDRFPRAEASLPADCHPDARPLERAGPARPRRVAGAHAAPGRRRASHGSTRDGTAVDAPLGHARRVARSGAIRSPPERRGACGCPVRGDPSLPRPAGRRLEISVAGSPHRGVPGREAAHTSSPSPTRKAGSARPRPP